MYLTYFNGNWSEGNTPLFGAMDHSVWLGSSVFDGARSIRGHMADLRLHLQRVIVSAERLGLTCPLGVDAMEALVREGVARFPADAELYIRPLVFGTDGLLIPVPEKSAFALTLFDAPCAAVHRLLGPACGAAVPTRRWRHTKAKASALYANTRQGAARSAGARLRQCGGLRQHRQRGRIRVGQPVLRHAGRQGGDAGCQRHFLSGITRAWAGLPLLAQGAHVGGGGRTVVGALGAAWRTARPSGRYRHSPHAIRSRISSIAASIGIVAHCMYAIEHSFPAELSGLAGQVALSQRPLDSTSTCGPPAWCW
jgi:hypothetical protein